MTFKCTTKDEAGNPIVGIIIEASVDESGLTFRRSSDGNGFSDVAIQGRGTSLPQIGDHVLLSVIKEGFKVWTSQEQNIDLRITAQDQEVSITLSPFSGV